MRAKRWQWLLRAFAVSNTVVLVPVRPCNLQHRPRVLSLWCPSAVLCVQTTPSCTLLPQQTLRRRSLTTASAATRWAHPRTHALSVSTAQRRAAHRPSPTITTSTPTPTPDPDTRPQHPRLFIPRRASCLRYTRQAAGSSFTAPSASSRYFPCPPASLGLLRSPPCWQKPHTDRTSCSRLNLTTTLPPPPPPPVRPLRRLAASLNPSTAPPLRGQNLRNHDDNGTRRPRSSSTPTRLCTWSARLPTDSDRISVSATSTELAAKLVAAASVTSTSVRAAFLSAASRLTASRYQHHLRRGDRHQARERQGQAPPA